MTARPAALGLAALGLAALLALASTGCATNTRRAQSPQPQPLTRLTIATAAPIDPLIPADSFNTPAVGTRYVAVPVTIKAREKMTVEPARWIRAETKSGSSLAPAVVAGQEGDISAGGPGLGRLEAGGELRGVLIYEVPIGDSVTALVYQDDLNPPQRGSVPVP